MRVWTEKERKRQACIARRNKPWKASTGPQTLEGKERSKMNAYKKGIYTADYKTIEYALKLHKEFMKGVFLFHAAENRRTKLLNMRAEGTEKE